MLEEIGERELAILVDAATAGCTAVDLREAVKWSGGLIEARDLDNYRTAKDRPKALAALAPRDLVRLGVYAVLHHELRQAFQYTADSPRPWADWYLADQQPRPKDRPLVEAFPRAAADKPESQETPQPGEESVGAFVDRCLEYGSFKGWIVDALQQRFGPDTPKVAAKQEVEWGVQRWKRHPEARIYRATQYGLPPPGWKPDAGLSVDPDTPALGWRR